MNQLLNIFSNIVPVIIMVAIGFLFRKKNVLDTNAIQSLKYIVFRVTLPMVLFGAFYKVKYDFNVFICFAVIFTSCGAALFLGFIIRKVFRIKGKMMPFLMTGFEAGMLGYSLYSIQYGAENISKFAMADLGQTIFVYTVVMTILNYQASGKDGIKIAVKSMFTTPAFIGVLIGIALGVTGMGAWINSSVFGPALTNCIKFIGTPTSALILLIVGYELEFSAENIKTASATIIARISVMLLLSFAVINIISVLTGGIDRLLRAAIMVLFILPAPFVIPLFVDSNDEKEYVATTLSLNTLLTLVIFMIIAAVIK